LKECDCDTYGLILTEWWVVIVFVKEEYMSGKIDPGAAQPSERQEFELSDRNPVVNHFGGEGEGGQIESPAAGAARVTPEGPPVSPDAGLKY
jgi:hypothetical protein